MTVLRFVRPVFIGDTITVTARSRRSATIPSAKTIGIVVEAIEIINQRGEAVLVCDHLYLVERRSGSAAVIPPRPATMS